MCLFIKPVIFGPASLATGRPNPTCPLAPNWTESFEPSLKFTTLATALLLSLILRWGTSILQGNPEMVLQKTGAFTKSEPRLFNPRRLREKSGAPLKYCAVTQKQPREGKSQRSDRPQVSLFKNNILSYFIHTSHCGLNLSTGGNGMGMGTWQNLQCNGPKFDLLFGKKIIVTVDNRNLKQDILISEVHISMKGHSSL